MRKLFVFVSLANLVNLICFSTGQTHEYHLTYPGSDSFVRFNYKEPAKDHVQTFKTHSKPVNPYKPVYVQPKTQRYQPLVYYPAASSRPSYVLRPKPFSPRPYYLQPVYPPYPIVRPYKPANPVKTYSYRTVYEPSKPVEVKSEIKYEQKKNKRVDMKQEMARNLGGRTVDLVDNVIEQEPVLITVSQNGPEKLVDPTTEAQVLFEEPVDAEVIIEEPVDTEVIFKEPVDTEVNLKEPVDTELNFEKPVDTEVIFEEPVDTEIIIEEPVDTEEGNEIEQKPVISAEVLNVEPVDTEAPVPDLKPVSNEEEKQLNPDQQGVEIFEEPVVETSVLDKLVDPSLIIIEDKSVEPVAAA